jgi:hypothetical protein
MDINGSQNVGDLDTGDVELGQQLDLAPRNTRINPQPNSRQQSRLA